MMTPCSPFILKMLNILGKLDRNGCVHNGQRWVLSIFFRYLSFKLLFFWPTSDCEQLILQQLNFMINNVKKNSLQTFRKSFKVKTDLDIMNSISLFHNFVILVCNMFVCVCVCVCVCVLISWFGSWGNAKHSHWLLPWAFSAWSPFVQCIYTTTRPALAVCW